MRMLTGRSRRRSNERLLRTCFRYASIVVHIEAMLETKDTFANDSHHRHEYREDADWLFGLAL
jgi:hypothetical protein